MKSCCFFLGAVLLMVCAPIAMAGGSGFSLAGGAQLSEYNLDLGEGEGYLLEARFQSRVLPPNPLTGRIASGQRYIAAVSYRDLGGDLMDHTRLRAGVGSMSAGVFRSGGMINYNRYDSGVEQAMITLEPMIGVKLGPVTLDGGVKLTVSKLDETRMHGALLRGNLRVTGRFALFVEGDVDVLNHDEQGDKLRMRTLGAGLRYTF